MLCGLIACNVYAQVNDSVYKIRYSIDPEQQGELRVDINSLSFFRNNEFSTPAIKGYTLPGFRLQPKLTYYPLKNIRLEAGIHILRYWGAEKYPNVAFRDIATWRLRHSQNALHLLPFFRAQAAFPKDFDIILGNIYGGINHNLIAPFYTPELDLTADPEAGAQVLYRSTLLDLDAWVNWESFIFKLDDHQEAFLFGLSSRIKWNRDKHSLHFYSPVQILAHHKGGEIDSLSNDRVQTLMNYAVGFGAQWRLYGKAVRQMNFEIDALGYSQQKGEEYAFKRGGGLFASVTADMRHVRFKADYFYGHKFISIMGYPFYGCVSMEDPTTTYTNTHTTHFGVDYFYTFAPGFSFGADFDAYLHGPVHTVDGDGVKARVGASTSYTFGAYLRINPSFLLKRFK